MASADLVVAAVASSGAEDMALRRPQARRVSGAWDASIVALCACNTRHRAESGGGTKASSYTRMDSTRPTTRETGTAMPRGLRAPAAAHAKRRWNAAWHGTLTIPAYRADQPRLQRPPSQTALLLVQDLAVVCVLAHRS
jgi:hypothetical protein